MRDGAYAGLSLAATGAAAWVADRIGSVAMADPSALLASGGIARAVLTPSWDPASATWAVVAGLGVAVGFLTHWTKRPQLALEREVHGTEHGGARWATDAEAADFAHTSEVRHTSNGKKAKNPKPDWCETVEDDNVILSRRSRLQLSKIPDPLYERNKHVLVVGGSGAGKTFNFVGPNLLQLNGSYVVTDPKGATAKDYAPFFASHGYRVVIVDTKPDEMRYSMRYNPLRYLTDATSVLVLVNLLIENTSGDKGGSVDGNHDFFVKAERQLYTALIGYLLYFCEEHPERQTFSEMINLLQSAKEGVDSGASLLDRMIEGPSPEDQGGKHTPSFVDFLVEKYGSKEAAEASDDWFVVTNYRGFKSTAKSPETEASILASCNVRMAPFSTGDVRRFFSDDELELKTIGTRPTAMFLVMSDTDSTFNFILAMLIYQLFDVNTTVADTSPGSHLPIPVNCILDEVANIGKIPDLDTKMATMRSRWVNIDPILQNLDQLKRWYKDQAQVIIGNCDTFLYLGRSDLETCKKISERIGKRTVPVKSTSESHGSKGSSSTSTQWIAQDLISAADLMGNPDKFRGDECIVMINGARPVKDLKYMTTEHPRYHELRECGSLDLAAYGAQLDRARAASLHGSLGPVHGRGTLGSALVDRVRWAGLEEGRAYELRVSALDRDGRELELADGATQVVLRLDDGTPTGTKDVAIDLKVPMAPGDVVVARESVWADGICWASSECSPTASIGPARFPRIVPRTPSKPVWPTDVRLGEDWHSVKATFVLEGLARCRRHTLVARLQEKAGDGWREVSKRELDFDSGMGGSKEIEVTFDHDPGPHDVRVSATWWQGATTSDLDGGEVLLSDAAQIENMMTGCAYRVVTTYEAIDPAGNRSTPPEPAVVSERAIAGPGAGVGVEVSTSASLDARALGDKRVRVSERLVRDGVRLEDVARCQEGARVDVPDGWDGSARVAGRGGCSLDGGRLVVPVRVGRPALRCERVRVVVAARIRRIDGRPGEVVGTGEALVEPGGSSEVRVGLEGAEGLWHRALVPDVRSEAVGVPVTELVAPDGTRGVTLPPPAAGGR